MFKLLAIALVAVSSSFAQDIPQQDRVRVDEFYRLAAQLQDSIWPAWSKTPAPLLLVTPEAEYLFHHPNPPPDFKNTANTWSRPRQFSTNLLATFPAFGPPSVIVIGEPQNTDVKKSTPWLFVVMHEHFHQLQNDQPCYFQSVEQLGLSKGDKTGMWMLNYPFPYDKSEIVRGFAHLRDLLLRVLSESDESKMKDLARQYVSERKKVMAQLSPDDHKYFSFQLWQEGIARYTQIKAAEAAAKYIPSSNFQHLPDYEPIASYASHVRADTLAELKDADLSTWKRTFIYPFGAAEGLLLDRQHPGWQSEYFKHLFTTDALFDLR